MKLTRAKLEDLVSPIIGRCKGPLQHALDDAKHFKGICEEVAADHDVTDLDAAMHVVNAARAGGRTPTGLLYRVDRPTLDERMAQLVENVGGHKDYDLRKIIDLSRP